MSIDSGRENPAPPTEEDAVISLRPVRGCTAKISSRLGDGPVSLGIVIIQIW